MKIGSEKTFPIRALTVLFLKRLFTSVVMIFVLIFFIVAMMGMSRQSGGRTLTQSILYAFPESISYLNNLFDGRIIEGIGLAELLPRSLILLLTSLTLAVLIGLPVGLMSAVWRHKPKSRILTSLTLLGISTPSFLVAMLLIWLNIWIGQVRGEQFLPVFGVGFDEHMIMPTLVLAAIPMANISRLGHNALEEVLSADHVRTARAKGLRERRVFLQHVIRTAGIPLLTIIGVSVRFSLAVLPIVEYIFSWRGIGFSVLGAIQSGDTTAAVTLILPFAILLLLINILLEVAYSLLDPRVLLKPGGMA